MIMDIILSNYILLLMMLVTLQLLTTKEFRVPHPTHIIFFDFGNKIIFTCATYLHIYYVQNLHTRSYVFISFHNLHLLLR